MKYYAVKNGRRPGIYTTWDECKAQVDGFSGAVYKSFSSESDARSFICPESEEDRCKLSGGAVCYVDGSYNINTREFSFGAVVFSGGEIKTFAQKYNDANLADMRNVAGELKGAEFVMDYCIQNQIDCVDIYYDYEGIAAWAQGRWKTNKAGTRAYKEFYDSLKDSLTVRFIKVKGHSGDKYNDMADALAKEAVGIGTVKK